ncbi:major capsid protein [Methylobacillus sp. Pita2]|uniref:major capsid protein n=1 Tax=Methylobacillus sp. Pita2 TaxID=3383245 RepID=UPI0038B68387
MKLINQTRKFGTRVVKGAIVASPLALASQGASAAIDVSEITTLFADAVTAVAAVGVAMLLVWGTKKAYNSIRGN